MIDIISLFAGIGLFDLGVIAALEEVGLGARVVAQVEIDQFCRAVLERHYPDADRSITDVRTAKSSNLPRADLIIGGFPCQDVSGAGKGAGLSGERSGLWWEYLRIVDELRPAVVLVENVASGMSRWLGPVRCSLEALGYRTRARQISAADVGAPHRRERVFVLAHSDGQRRVEPEGRERNERRWVENSSSVAYAGREWSWFESWRSSRTSGASASCVGGRGEGMGVTSGEQRGSSGLAPGIGAGAWLPSDSGSWQAQPILGRDAHGRAAGLDAHRWPAGRGGAQRAWEPPRTVTGKEPHRRARIRALGNAVVPHQARDAMRWALDVIGGAA
jgi:DNA (cytosine-5)-methyltransferase 1